jgi:hypothetical protein
MQADSMTSAECWLANALFPVPDRRASPRVRTVCLVVKVNRGGKAAILRARNLSDDGMMLSTPAPLDVGERVLINLSEKLAVHGTVLWADKDRSGVKFVRPIDSAALLRAAEEQKRVDRRGGAQRLATMRLATTYAENGIRAVRITNVSHRGMGLAHDGSLAPGMLLKLVVESGLERGAAVRWSDHGRAGIRLMEPLTCEELAQAASLEHLGIQFRERSAFFNAEV